MLLKRIIVLLFFIASFMVALSGCKKLKQTSAPLPITPTPPAATGIHTVYPATGKSLATVKHLTQSNDYIVEFVKAI